MMNIGYQISINSIWRYRFHILSVLICWSLLGLTSLDAQMTVIRGKVLDAENDEPLIGATISFLGTSTGVNTDFEGNYELKSKTATDTIIVAYLGYETLLLPIEIGKKQKLDIRLSSGAIQLQDVVVTTDGRYSNKNPAVALIKKVIANKKENRASNYDFYEYEKYEKLVLGLSNVSEKFKNRKIFKKFQFLFEDMDTTSLKGKEVLPIYLKEILSDVRYRKSPEKTKELILADTMISFEGYVDNDGLNQYLDNLYQKIDIYDNNIVILNQQFLSPVANGAPTFYKYFIQDTLQVDGTECIELFFAPKNKLDILFQGYLYIAYQDGYNIKKIDMSINPQISLNWVKDLNLVQEFEKIGDEGYIQVSDEFSADFGLFRKGMGIFGRRLVSNKDIKINQPRPNEDYKGIPIEHSDNIGAQLDDFWESRRHKALSTAEETTYGKIDSLQNVKVFKRAMNIASLVLSGYTNVGPYFEIGPVNTFYSFSPIEGLRLRVGGRTTPKFSRKIEIENYLAYGFKDERYKGYLGVSYAVGGGNLQQFPARRFRASFQHDTKIPGLALQFIQEDNILLSFKRGANDKFLYNTNYRFEYLHEFSNHFSFRVGYRNWLQNPAGNLTFEKLGDNGELTEVEDLHSSELKLSLRWAPNERFYQGKTYRRPIINAYPIFTLKYNQGVEGLFGGEYNYQQVSLEIFKRFYLSRLGYSDFFLDAGMTFGSAPYPLLDIHPANQTYAYQLRVYNLMNFLEFVSDRYVSFNIDHSFNGFFLNRIPLIRRLKLREAFNVRVLYGGLSDQNTPTPENGLLFFPKNGEGNPTTFTLEEKPYIEASIGLSNVLKFFRIDLVRRFTYLDNPNVAEFGVRARFKVYF